MSDVILWRRIDLPGHEYARLDPLKDGWRLSGTSVFMASAAPTKIDYVVTCDSRWWTQSAHISATIGDEVQNLDVSVDDARGWYLNGTRCDAVEGCIDVDLGFSPSTNLLPIRRLDLDIGDETPVRAAWLPFPSLRLEPLDQLYRREGELIYRYQSGGGAFVRTLEVNAAGFVVSYPGLWQAEVQPEVR